jgi:hypothetical protein
MRTCHRGTRIVINMSDFRLRSHFPQSSFFCSRFSLPTCIFHTVPTVHTRLFLCGGERAMNILRPANVVSGRRRCGHQAHEAREREKIKLGGSCTQAESTPDPDPCPRLSSSSFMALFLQFGNSGM